MTRILVADDHPLFREALSGALEPYFENAQIIQAGSLDDAMAKLNEFDGVELILLDLNMPGGEYFNGLITLREQYPNIPVGVVSGSDTVDCRSSNEPGCSRFYSQSVANAVLRLL